MGITITPSGLVYAYSERPEMMPRQEGLEGVPLKAELSLSSSFAASSSPVRLTRCLKAPHLPSGRRTTESRLKNNTVIPTLKATPGDISLVLPYRILTNIIETIYALDKVAPGTANDDTLLYGCESKYYSLKPKHNEKFEIRDNMYLIGDGAGIARGLSQSAAMGIYVADMIV